MKAPSLTLGVEEEYQVVDPVSGALRPWITSVVREGKAAPEGIRPEMHQSTVEVGTRVCRTPAEIRAEIVRLRRSVSRLAEAEGLRIVASGTHPFSSWTESPITPTDRYLGLEEDLQDVARRNLVFGTHVHVGIEDRDFLIDALRAARYFLPHLLALSVSSPFWEGRDTGLRSYRTSVWRTSPRAGVPPDLSSWADYERLVSDLVRARSLEDPTKIWWDIRPSHFFPTLEVRVCDMCTRVDEVVCVAALVQALVAKLWKLRCENLAFRSYPRPLLAENKFRAARYGLDGKLIDLGRGQEVHTRETIRWFVTEFLDDVLDDLGSRAEAEVALTILNEGSSARRQLEAFARTGDLVQVVRRLVRETAEGCGAEQGAELGFGLGAPA